MTEGEPFPHTVLAVGHRSVCVWDQDLLRHNLDFCESFDPRWFVEAISSHWGEAEDVDDVPQAAALAIRQVYHHALETFFALLFAFFQAPRCLPAWLELYEFSVLRDLIRSVQRQSTILNAWGLPNPDWVGLARLTTEPAWRGDDRTAERFGLLWQRLAGDYVDEQHAAEHAALKHGFRAHASGGALEVGLEHEFGLAPPREEMKWLGGSRHGSSTFVAQPLPSGTGRRKAIHYHLRVQSFLWLLEATILKVQLLSTSMENILGAARVRNGVPANEVLFHRPQNPETFDAPWRKSTGVTGFSMGLVGPGDAVQHIPRTTVERIMRELSGLTGRAEPGASAT